MYTLNFTINFSIVPLNSKGLRKYNYIEMFPAHLGRPKDNPIY